MKIETIRIKDFKGIGSEKVEVLGKNIFLVGGNGTGKTSFIDAVWFCLTGKRLPTEAVRKGAKASVVEVELEDYVARVKVKPGKTPTFELERKKFESEGEKFVKSPRTFLNDAIGVIDFDIATFFSKTGKEQVDYFCKIIGIDFADIDGKISEAMEQRKLDKKRFELLTKQADFFDKSLLEKEPIDIVQLSKTIAAEVELRADRDRVAKGIERTGEEIKGIDEQIKLLQAQRSAKEQQIADGVAWLQDVENTAQEEEIFTGWNAQLETANADNKKIEEAKRLKLIDDELETLTGNIEALDIAVEDWRKSKSDLLAQSIKVEGLKYDASLEMFKYNELPFERNQINTAAGIIAGLQITSSLLKELKIARLDASLVDNANMEKIKEFAAENGIELFVELVDRNAEALEIVVE